MAGSFSYILVAGKGLLRAELQDAASQNMLPAGHWATQFTKKGLISGGARMRFYRFQWVFCGVKWGLIVPRAGRRDADTLM
jgi:hypothetical protein